MCKVTKNILSQPSMLMKKCSPFRGLNEKIVTFVAENLNSLYYEDITYQRLALRPYPIQLRQD